MSQPFESIPLTPTDPEDRKIITLARAARGRTGADQGACVRDGDGRTYAATSIGLLTCIMMIAIPIKIPTSTNGHGILPPTIPCASRAINPACGAGRARSPRPVPPAIMLLSWSSTSGKYITALATTTAINSTIWMLRGVPPSM